MRIIIFSKFILIKIIVYFIFQLKKIKFLENISFFKNIFYLYDLDKLINDNLCWWTYSIQRNIEDILIKYKVKNILEFGSGASTIYFAKKGYKITSIEYDKNWFHRIKKYLEKFNNSEIHLLEKDKLMNFEYLSKKNLQSYKKYVEFPLSLKKKYDLIIIDGRAREKCLELSPLILSEDGIIIFDDTERSRYKVSIKKFLLKHNYKEIKFTGLAPGSFFKNRSTSLISK